MNPISIFHILDGFHLFVAHIMQMYQFMLSLQMLLLVTFMWTPKKFKRLLEYKLHAFIVVSAVVVSSFPLFFGGYLPQCGMCDAALLPYWCANVYKGIFWASFSFISLFCTGAMMSVYRSVYLEEKKMNQYRLQSEQDEDDGKDDSESKRIQKTLLLYTSSFYICWIIPIIFWNATSVPALHIVADTLFSFMGFFNMIVFIQPKCIKYQTEHPGYSLVACYFYVIFSGQIKLRQRSAGMERTHAANFDDGIGFETYNHRLSEYPKDDEDGDTPPVEPEKDGVRPLSFVNTNIEFVNANTDTPPAEPAQASEIGVHAATDHQHRHSHVSDGESSHDTSYGRFLAFNKK